MSDPEYVPIIQPIATAGLYAEKGDIVITGDLPGKWILTGFQWINQPAAVASYRMLTQKADYAYLLPIDDDAAVTQANFFGERRANVNLRLDYVMTYFVHAFWIANKARLKRRRR